MPPPIRSVMRSFVINTYRSDQMLQHGNVNEDRSIEQTGHRYVPIRYNQTLFRVADQSGRLLEEITVDEGMADLLRAVWRHGIPTTGSCQGVNNEWAWIWFESFEDSALFYDLVSSLLGNDEWRIQKEDKRYEFSFPQEKIVRITEELNNKTVTQFTIACSVKQNNPNTGGDS
jgi:hypothetical protein